MKTFLLLCCCFQVYFCVDTGQQGSVYELNVRPRGVMSGTLQRIVKTYHCATDVEGQQIILYGTKSWTFPTQNVNLTLKYPSTKSEETEEYVITGLLVVLHIDGPHSRGYVTQGGVLRDRISMTFAIENISRLSYQFWLYGVRTFSNISDFSLQKNLCSLPY